MQEIWIDQFAGEIPADRYTLQLQTGETHGLFITLIGISNYVVLDFGFVHAVTVLDEGVLLNDPSGRTEGDSFLKVRAAGFPSVMYLVENGSFAQHVQVCMGTELYQVYGLRQYTVVTENYVIEIVCRDKPDILVKRNNM